MLPHFSKNLTRRFCLSFTLALFLVWQGNPLINFNRATAQQGKRTSITPEEARLKQQAEDERLGTFGLCSHGNLLFCLWPRTKRAAPVSTDILLSKRARPVSLGNRRSPLS